MLSFMRKVGMRSRAFGVAYARKHRVQGLRPFGFGRRPCTLPYLDVGPAEPLVIYGSGDVTP